MAPLPNCTKSTFPLGGTSKFTLCICSKVRCANESHIPACKYSRMWSIIINTVSASCQVPVGKNPIWIRYKLAAISIKQNSFLALKLMLVVRARQ